MAENKQILEKLIREAQMGESALPPLKRETEDFNPLEMLWEWLKSQIDLDGLNLGVPASTMMLTLSVLYYILLAAIIVLTVYYTLRVLSKPQTPFSAVTPVSDGMNSPLDSLEAELLGAKERNDWSLALRLRWRLFLQQTSRTCSMTLSEFFPREYSTQVEQFYACMFGGRETTKHTFDDLEKLLP